MRTFILFIFMTIGTATLQPAKSEARECIAEGWYDVSLYGDYFNGRLWGRIGNHRIDWRLWTGWIDGDLNGHRVRLRYDDSDRERPVIEGWVGQRTYLRWQAQGGRWSGWQWCIE